MFAQSDYIHDLSGMFVKFLTPLVNISKMLSSVV